MSGEFPKKVLVATDGSEDAALATETAVDLARRAGSELHVVHVLIVPPETLHDPVSFDTEIREEIENRARASLEEAVRKIEASGGAVEKAHFKVGRPDTEIVNLAEDLMVDLIAMGSRGLGGLRRALMGSTSEGVVRHAHCAVLVVRQEPIVFPTRILLATDGSEEAELAARAVVEVSGETGSELHLVHVAPSVPMLFAATEEEPARLAREGRKTLDDEARRIEAAGGNVAQTHLRLGAAAEEIVALAEDMGAGLIALGSRGRGGIRRALMGSVSDAVVRHAHCPVLVARGD